MDSHAHRFNWIDWVLGVGIGLLGLALYVRTLAPGLLWGDSAEFQTLAYTLGMTHPTGYPVFILLLKPFTWLPFFDPAGRVNLASAVFGGLALSLVYLVGRLLGARRLAALLGPAALGLSVLFWWQAVVVELYTAAAAMIALVLALVLLWGRSGAARWLFWAGLAGGLSLGIHNTVTLIAPAVLVYLLLNRAGRKDWLAAAGGALAGLALTLAAVLALDANNPPSSYYHAVVEPSLSIWGMQPAGFDSPFERLAFLVAARQFRPMMFSQPPAAVVDAAGVYWETLVDNFSIPLAVFAAAGWAGLFAGRFKPGRWKEGVLLLGGFLAILVFDLNYHIGDIMVFFIPTYVFVAAGVSLGGSLLLDAAGWLVGRLRPEQAPGTPIVTGAQVALGLLLLPALAWPNRVEALDSLQAGKLTFLEERGWGEYPYPVFLEELPEMTAQSILQSASGEDAIIFTDWGRIYPIYFEAHVRQGKTGVAVHESIPQDGEVSMARSALAYIDANLGKRPIYFTDPPAGLRAAYKVMPVASNLYKLIEKK